MAGSGARRFKQGCLGCLALIVFTILALGTLTGVAFLRAPSEENRQRTRHTQEVPQVELPAAVVADAADPGAPPPIFPAAGIDVSEPGRVVLDLSTGSFVVEAGPAGEPIRVEAYYDHSAFELEQGYESDGETGWTYRLSFKQRGWLRMIISESSDPAVTLILPRGSPMSLEASISKGESTLDLGGLWLLSADLELGMGEHDVRFNDPLASPMERFTVDGSMGAIGITRLGNASPSVVDVEHSMGELTVDLRGSWARDATVDARCGMGECSIRLPRDIPVDLASASVTMGGKNVGRMMRPEDAEPGSPVLHLSARASMGELRIR
jgi:hypothetical protein